MKTLNQESMTFNWKEVKATRFIHAFTYQSLKKKVVSFQWWSVMQQLYLSTVLQLENLRICTLSWFCCEMNASHLKEMATRFVPVGGLCIRLSGTRIHCLVKTLFQWQERRFVPDREFRCDPHVSETAKLLFITLFIMIRTFYFKYLSIFYSKYFITFT